MKYHVKIELFVKAKLDQDSDSDPNWFGSLDPDSDLHWGKKLDLGADCWSALKPMRIHNIGRWFQVPIRSRFGNESGSAMKHRPQQFITYLTRLCQNIHLDLDCGSGCLSQIPDPNFFHSGSWIQRGPSRLQWEPLLLWGDTLFSRGSGLASTDQDGPSQLHTDSPWLQSEHLLLQGYSPLLQY